MSLVGIAANGTKHKWLYGAVSEVIRGVCNFDSLYMRYLMIMLLIQSYFRIICPQNSALT